MATNPNNAIGTNGALNGRTSVNAFNDALATYNDRGVLSGWTCLASSGMTVELGGISGRRDVAVAMDANGNFTTINNISGSPISVTLPAAPGTNKRIDAVVAYVDNPPQGTATDTDNPGACGIIPVSGTVAANPSMPNETTIRSAITADGASGSSAYYVVLAKITVASGTTDIDNTMIEAGQHAEIQGATVGTGALADGAVTADKVDWATLPHQFKNADNQPLTLTCTKAGTYYVFAQTSWNGNATKVFSLKKNGSTTIVEGVDSRSGGGIWGNVTVNGIVSLAVNDTIGYYDGSTLVVGGNYSRNAIGMIYIGS